MAKAATPLPIRNTMAHIKSSAETLSISLIMPRPQHSPPPADPRHCHLQRKSSRTCESKNSNNCLNGKSAESSWKAMPNTNIFKAKLCNMESIG